MDNKLNDTQIEILKLDPSYTATWLKDPENLAGLLMEKKGKQEVPTLCTENICKILELHQKIFGSFRFDEFRQVYEIRPPGKSWRHLEDSDPIFIQTDISSFFPFFQKVQKTMVFDAITKVSLKNKCDTAVDYVKGLVWDEKPRLDTWLCEAYGVADNPYHRSIGSNWMKGLVKRIIEPGCKFDFVLVLEGEQGAKKSMSLNILGGNWYVETTMSTDSKDFFMQFHGKVIVEFSEGETLSRTEVKRMKAIISTEVDRYRPPYERVSKDFPRRCVFAMTTNQDEYLKDETGNRRWFPIRLVFPEANVTWIKEVRDQLFAEAYHRITVLKENCYEFPKEDSILEQRARRIREADEDIVLEWYTNQVSAERKRMGITIRDAFTEAINGGFNKSMSRQEQMQIGNIFRLSLNLIKRRKMVNGIQGVRWFTEEDLKINDIVDAAVGEKTEEKFATAEVEKPKLPLKIEGKSNYDW